jgi:t-SNARE complex subunit (syntaxin)
MREKRNRKLSCWNFATIIIIIIIIIILLGVVLTVPGVAE